MHRLRLARGDDLGRILEIIEGARKFLGVQGLPQWQGENGPSPALISGQIKNSEGYVLEENNATTMQATVHGYAALVPGLDNSYENIDGKWAKGRGPYLVIHTVAIDAKVRGKRYGSSMLALLSEQAQALGFRDVRLDTHPGNIIMQRVIATCGFFYCGEIMLDIPNGVRSAYQLLYALDPTKPNVRLASEDDAEAACEAIESAREFLARRGSLQWQGGYGPGPEDVYEGIRLRNAFVLEDFKAGICGYASLDPGPDSDYNTISSGSWNDSHTEYSVINNVAIHSSGRGHGYCTALISGILQAARARGYKDIRSCTRAENILMCKCFEKMGFVKQGDMRLDIPNGERIAYQLVDNF